MELVGKGETILWDKIEASSSKRFTAEINDAMLRNNMLKKLTGRIEDLRFPYFIPESKEHLALPLFYEK